MGGHDCYMADIGLHLRGHGVQEKRARTVMIPHCILLVMLVRIKAFAYTPSIVQFLLFNPALRAGVRLTLYFGRCGRPFVGRSQVYRSECGDGGGG